MTVLKPVHAFILLLLWGIATGAVVLLNKSVLDPHLGNLPYPLTLTACHMLCCSVFAAFMISSGAVDHQPLSLQTYTRFVDMPALYTDVANQLVNSMYAASAGMCFPLELCSQSFCGLAMQRLFTCQCLSYRC